MEEIWKVITDSDGHYFISNMGRMKRDNYMFLDKVGRKINVIGETLGKGTYNRKNGYWYFSYRTASKTRKSRSIHRLVAEAFIPNPHPDIFDQVNHMDGDKSNNQVDNLEWCNTKLNMEHASKHGLINRDSEKRKRQAAINGRVGAVKHRLSCAKYDKDGNLCEIMDCLSTTNANINRLTFCGFTYRYCHILLQQYGEIPKHINAQRSFEAASRKRKKYVEHTVNGETKEYITLSELPISREMLWFAFNHQVPDKINKSMWDIIELDKSLIPKQKRTGVEVHGLDDNGNICLVFKTIQEMQNYMNIKGLNWFYKCVTEHRKYKGYYWETIHDTNI